MLAQISRTYLRNTDGSPYVGYKVKVTFGLSEVPAVLYSDSLPTPTVLSQGGVLTLGADGIASFYVSDDAEYTLQLLHPLTNAVVSVERRVEARSVALKSVGLSEAEAAALQTVLQNGGATGNASIQFSNAGVPLGSTGTVNSIDFTGSLIASRSGNQIQVGTISTAYQSQIIFRENGQQLAAPGVINKINFLTPGLTVTRFGDQVNLRVSGSNSGVPRAITGNTTLAQPDVGATLASQPDVPYTIFIPDDQTLGISPGNAEIKILLVGTGIPTFLGASVMGSPDDFRQFDTIILSHTGFANTWSIISTGSRAYVPGPLALGPAPLSLNGLDLTLA